MAFDYKKEFQALYQPKTASGVVAVSAINYAAVRDRI